ncbi:MAG: glycosyltransferase [Actinomycetota bacterium]|nr:glycosyltransferase [Actinomycetota bacterium]
MSGGAGRLPVTVLMATHNGRRWLPEQWESILSQQGVDVTLIVSDDTSDDGTYEWLCRQAAGDDRVTVLPRVPRVGGAATNFYRLITDLEVGDGHVVALADQDDIWLPGKLAAQTALVASGDADGVSSDVTAFHDDGHRELVRKAFPQRRFDYVFESPGPGSTFVLSARLVRQVQQLLADETAVASRLEFHDWLIYGVCRALGWPWVIQDIAWVDYRQHQGNAFGANLGLRSGWRRLCLVGERWHRREALALLQVALAVAPEPTRRELEELRHLLCGTDVRSRWGLARRAGQLRRRPRDRLLLGVLMSAGIW